MQVELRKPVSSSSNADNYDIKQLKVALNRLDYYLPPEEIGISDVPDTALFNGIRKFQSDHGLRATGSLRPSDDTVKLLNLAVSAKDSGAYVWRTVGDSKVRAGHAALNNTVQDFSEAPLPGDEFNCRCWAESVGSVKPFVKHELLEEPEDAPDSWDPDDFLNHFWNGEGRPVTLEQIGHAKGVIEYSTEEITPKVIDQIIELAQQRRDGSFGYHTKNTYRFHSVSYPVGSATLETYTSGTISNSRGRITVKARTEYTFFDEFTDPIDLIGNDGKGTPSGRPSPDENGNHPGYDDWREIGGNAYDIHGNWAAEINMVIEDRGRSGAITPESE